MANITLGGTPITTNGELPKTNSKAATFSLTATDLSTKTLSDFAGKRKILNIFPSIDTGVCATSTKTFNEEASSLDNAVVLCISKDLPFAHNRFCAAEGLEDVVMLSDFKTGDFGKTYGLEIQEGGFAGLHARAIVVLDENDNVLYTEQVPEIGQEPNYTSALNALS